MTCNERPGTAAIAPAAASSTGSGILGHGSALAWDIKFLLAKFLFCCGFGLLILRLLGNGPLSLIYSALAAWCGAFFYINNHPAFFVFCYAPWILLSALAFLDLRRT